jgi:hypothetical protein
LIEIGWQIADGWLRPIPLAWSTGI